MHRVASCSFAAGLDGINLPSFPWNRSFTANSFTTDQLCLLFACICLRSSYNYFLSDKSDFPQSTEINTTTAIAAASAATAAAAAAAAAGCCCCFCCCCCYCFCCCCCYCCCYTPILAVTQLSASRRAIANKEGHSVSNQLTLIPRPSYPTSGPASAPSNTLTR